MFYKSAFLLLHHMKPITAIPGSHIYENTWDHLIHHKLMSIFNLENPDFWQIKVFVSEVFLVSIYNPWNIVAQKCNILDFPNSVDSGSFSFNIFFSNPTDPGCMKFSIMLFIAWNGRQCWYSSDEMFDNVDLQRMKCSTISIFIG